MYSEELVKKVFDYDGRMLWLRGEGGSNRQEDIFYKLNIHYLRDKDVDNQDTKIKAVITKIESVVGKIAKLISDLAYSGQMKGVSANQESILRLVQEKDNFFLEHWCHKMSREIIYTVLALSIVDLDGHLKDETRLGDDGIDKELEEITQDIRVLLDIEGWKMFFEFIDHIATKESIRWFTSTELGFVVRNRLERELLKTEVETKIIEEEKKKRVELEKELEELKQKIKQQPEQKD